MFLIKTRERGERKGDGGGEGKGKSEREGGRKKREREREGILYFIRMILPRAVSRKYKYNKITININTCY
jgi:hypothetical protein